MREREHRQARAHALAGNRERTGTRIEKDSGGATMKGGNGTQEIAGMDGGGSATSTKRDVMTGAISGGDVMIEGVLMGGMNSENAMP